MALAGECLEEERMARQWMAEEWLAGEWLAGVAIFSLFFRFRAICVFRGP